MLPRILVLLVVIGLVAGAAERPSDNRGPYQRDQYGPYDRNVPTRHEPYNNQYYNQNPNQYTNQYTNTYNNQYDQTRNVDPSYTRNPDNTQYGGNMNRNNMMNGQYVYAKNQTAIFCYLNGTRIQQEQNQPSNIGASFNTNEIDVNSCTHLLLGAAIIHPNTHLIQIIDANFESESGKLSFNTLSEYKRQNRDLKVLVSISGDPRVWSIMAHDGNQRQHFANSVKNFVNQYNLDGVNIDWQWPVGAGMGNSRNDYLDLLLVLKQGERNKLLTAFIPAEEMQISELLQQFNTDYVDFYILMALELRGHNYQKIEHHAPVDSYTSGQTVKKAIYNIQRYVPEQYHYQFILSIPFYGKRYQLDSRNLQRDESPMGKPFTKQHMVYRDTLTASYAQICREMSMNKYQYGYDRTNEAAYIVHENTVYVYEDTESVRAKTRLALQNGFGGVMAFSIDMDDSTGTCQNPRARTTNDRNNYYQGGYSDRYPLLRAIYDQVQRGSAANFHTSPLAIAFAVVCAMILRINN